MLWVVLIASLAGLALSFQCLRYVLTVIENQQKLYDHLEHRFADLQSGAEKADEKLSQLLGKAINSN